VSTRFLVSTFLLPLFFVHPLVSQETPEKIAIRALDDAEMRRENQLPGYTVTERYALTSSRFNLAAEMTVETLYRKGQGETYRIVSRTGSPMLQSKVFDRLIREEREMTVGDTRLHLLARPDNYDMRLSGEAVWEGKKCYLLDLKPKVNSPHLLKGHAWTNQEDGSLIRIEGVPSASSSFLTGRPTIVREYQKVGEFWLVKYSQAVSKSLLFGTSELSINYENYRILER
jgi:hypothetical protein